MSKVKSIAPGLLLCLALAVPCYLAGTLVPVVGGPVFAILLGMAITLRWKSKDIVSGGIGFTSKYVLQTAVVLLGFGLDLNQIARVGMVSLPVILSTISIALVVAFVLCKAMRIPGRIATLVGVGSSICGGSAIAATAPIIRAEDEEVAQSISVIFLFNVIAAIIFPTLGTWFGLTDDGFGLFAGTAVNDTSSVTAAAAAWDGMHLGSDALDYATIVKLTRTLAIIPITLVLAIWVSSRRRKDSIADGAAAEKGGAVGGFSLRRSFPLFILLFLIAASVTTLCTSFGVSQDMFDPVTALSKFLIAAAMVAIGLNTDIAKLVRTGAKPLALGFACWAAIAATSLGVQHLMGLW